MRSGGGSSPCCVAGPAGRALGVGKRRSVFAAGKWKSSWAVHVSGYRLSSPCVKDNRGKRVPSGHLHEAQSASKSGGETSSGLPAPPPLCKGRWHGETVSEGLYTAAIERPCRRLAARRATEGDCCQGAYSATSRNTPLTTRNTVHCVKGNPSAIFGDSILSQGWFWHGDPPPRTALLPPPFPSRRLHAILIAIINPEKEPFLCN